MPVNLADTLTTRDLRTLTRLIYERAGISLHEGKRALVTARLQKRVIAGGFGSFSEYVSFVVSDGGGDELVALLDAISTNHTSFYREPQHFEFLARCIAGELGGRVPEIWSAACASGEEPYTIAMTLAAALPAEKTPGTRILASDLSTRALRTARAGVYPIEKVGELPRPLLERHFEKGLGAQAGLVRVNAQLKTLVEFRRLNLLDVSDLGRRFDMIFCRNVMIYFDMPVQQRVVAMLERHLRPGGWLFTSHSESLNGVRHGLRWVAPAIYRREIS